MVCVWRVFCIYYPTACSPKGYGSGLPLPSWTAAHFSAIKHTKKPNPVPNYMRVKPGRPDLLLP